MDWFTLIVLVVALLCIFGVPVYVIARRRGLKNAWVAFLPLLGIWIVLCEAMGKSGWFALLAFVPYAGPLALAIWTSVELPRRHGRTGWWTLALILPIVNVAGYWFYAFTLARDESAQLSFV
jgi:hypothetical protein